MVLLGRLPITERNIKIILQDKEVNHKTIICNKSKNAALTLVELREEMLKQREKEKLFDGYKLLELFYLFIQKHRKPLSKAEAVINEYFFVF